MSTDRPFASLTGGLLARKGEARPAMRPQPALPAAAPDDLGWNDLGVAPPVPPVVQQREAIAAGLGAMIEGEIADAAVRGKAKAAFTLRLDPERHLRLRLACALQNRSAQAVVVEALDALLDTIPAIDAAKFAATAKR